MHDGNLKPGQLDEKLVTETYKELNSAAGAGYGKGWTKFGTDAASDKAVLKLQQNLFNFSGAKTYAQLVEINDMLTKDGVRQDWPAFKAGALSTNPQYNVNHLQAEHQTCTQCGHAAVDWQRFQADIKVFPNVRFKTAGDRRVRDSHRALEGLVVPINHPFLKKYMTPLGFRCRCRWVQTAAIAAANIPTKVEGIASEFLNNVGMSDQVFPEKNVDGGKAHPYFAIARAGGKQVELSMERAKLYAPYTEVFETKTGAKVEVSPFADLNDMEDNFKTAITIAGKLDLDVKIRPHLNRDLIPGKNPEYEIRGKLADRKGIQGIKGVSAAIDRAKVQMLDKDTNPEQQSYIIVIDLTAVERFTLADLQTELARKITNDRGKHIHSMIFVNGKNAVELMRLEILRRDFQKLSKIQ